MQICNTYGSVEFLGGELSDVSNSGGGSLLESNTLESLVHVEGIVSGSVLELLLSSFFGTCHFKINLLIIQRKSLKVGEYFFA